MLVLIQLWIYAYDTAITDTGIQKLFSNLKTNKACGPDEIHAMVLKELSNIISPYMSLLFQSSLDNETVPRDWRSANVTPLLKKGERYRAENYRPVSLTCICCKVLEHVVVSNVMKHLETNHILYNLQFGFRSGRSCETQLLQLYHDLPYTLDKRVQTDVAVMDFAKVFDTVPHNRLLYKLKFYGIANKTNAWIRSFLQDRSQRVVVDGYRSFETEVTSGVPQGSVFGPVLFLVYINDLSEYTKFSKVRLFADDCILYRTVRNILDCQKLQEDLEGLQLWEDHWLMEFNVSKCSIM